MLAVLIGASPVIVLGLAALWARARADRLEIVPLIGEAPASKRSPRTQPVDVVVLHQMGFSRGDDLRRYRKVTAHFVIAPNGAVAQLHPLSARLSSSHGFNSGSVAIEFAGNFRSVDGKWWRPEKYGKNMLTRAQVDSGRRLLRLLNAQGIRYVFAHRQSSGDRGNDPGPEIWSQVGQWACSELGMSDGGPGYSIDTGYPIPDSWRSFYKQPSSAR